MRKKKRMTPAERARERRIATRLLNSVVAMRQALENVQRVRALLHHPRAAFTQSNIALMLGGAMSPVDLAVEILEGDLVTLGEARAELPTGAEMSTDDDEYPS